jgi:hypothetical protein
MNRVAANLPARRSSSSEEITMASDGLQTFIAGTNAQSLPDLDLVVEGTGARMTDMPALSRIASR